MDIMRFLVGTRRIRLTSADPEQVLRAINTEGITAADIEILDPVTWQFVVNSIDAKKIEALVDRRGEKCESSGTTGFYGILLKTIKRPILVAGLLLLIILSFWLPSKVLFVQVEGCQTVPLRLIIQEAEQCGIYFGASRNAIRSEQVKNKLLSQIPQLQWAGVRTVGCVAVITVTEKKENEEKEKNNGVCSLVAARDGIISEITILRGNGLCKVGQAVKAGQVLISGYTDCGICIQAQRAEGEILAHTKRDLSLLFPTERSVRVKIKDSHEKISLIIGKKVINFSKDSGIIGGSCAKIYEQKYIGLPGGFVLPVSILRERWVEYDCAADQETQPSVDLHKFAREYVLKQTIAGRIEHTKEQLTPEDGCVQLDAVYDCIENIGLVRMEENILDYGKGNGKNRQCGIH